MFLVFAHEACELGKQLTWAVDRIRSEVDEFLRRFTIEASHEKGHDKSGRRFRDVVSRENGSLLPEVKREFQNSEEWRDFEEQLLAVAEGQAAQDSQLSVPAESIIEIRAKFRQGAVEHPDLLAHWDSRQDLWTFGTAPVGQVAMPADPKSERSFKEAVRIAFGLLRNSRDPDIHALTSTLKEPCQVWLDFMRKENWGFRRWEQIRSSHFRHSVAWAEDRAPLPPDAVRLLEDGDIRQVFQESADLWDNLAARAFELGRAGPALASSGKVWTEHPILQELKTTRALVHPATVDDVNQKNPEPPFPNRAAWLNDRLRERSWNKHDLSRYGGPDHKTAQKVLNGFPVREDVLEKIADALSKRNGAVTVLDIPQD